MSLALCLWPGVSLFRSSFSRLPAGGKAQSLPVARVGQCIPGISLQPVSVAQIHWDAESSCWGGEKVSCPSQPVTSGLLPTHSHGSPNRAHLWVIILHQSTPGCQHDTQVSQTVFPLNASPCCHRPAMCKSEAGLRRLSITPSFSSSKTRLLKPPLGSLIFAWLYISGDIWTEIARKRL